MYFSSLSAIAQTPQNYRHPNGEDAVAEVEKQFGETGN
jgi:hypothetical protein